uniref:C-type lectin domain-containing protein n=1 Tax=Acrobeloides nanus TaxID=290746 RepID=A0A914C143_9BILA
MLRLFLFISLNIYSVSSCSDPFVSGLDDKCYFFSNTSATWAQAQNSCIALGGSLTSVKNASENQYISYMMSKISNQDYWIDGYRDNKNTWTWADLQNFTYSNWDTGEPNGPDNNLDYIRVEASNGAKWKSEDVTTEELSTTPYVPCMPYNEDFFLTFFFDDTRIGMNNMLSYENIVLSTVALPTSSYTERILNIYATSAPEFFGNAIYFNDSTAIQQLFGGVANSYGQTERLPTYNLTDSLLHYYDTLDTIKYRSGAPAIVIFNNAHVEDVGSALEVVQDLHKHKPKVFVLLIVLIAFERLEMSIRLLTCVWIFGIVQAQNPCRVNVIFSLEASTYVKSEVQTQPTTTTTQVNTQGIVSTIPPVTAPEISTLGPESSTFLASTQGVLTVEPISTASDYYEFASSPVPFNDINDDLQEIGKKIHELRAHRQAQKQKPKPQKINDKEILTNKLIMPTTRLEAVQSSSLNTAKKIWNALPTRIVEIGHHESFKSAVKDPAVYHHLISRIQCAT